MIVTNEQNPAVLAPVFRVAYNGRFLSEASQFQQIIVLTEVVV